MKLESIHKISTPELVVRELLKNIQSGELRPGGKLPSERELSKAFGVGRSSVREAISAMTLVGYLEVTQGKGIFLREDLPSRFAFNAKLSQVLEAYWLFDVIETREILECSLARLAAERAGPRDLRKLREMLEDLQGSQEDIDGFYRADFEFHMAICEAAENDVLCEMLRIIIEKTHSQYLTYLPDTLCRPERAIRTAELIVEAVEAKRGGDAAELMKEHLGIIKTELTRIMPEAESYKIRKESLKI
ncbi:MAG: FadR family transcriptional regulator [Desulfohalobiaceae bacterium]|nr:FadR family transcriptional regulator [Desulfohalobiaceae bacterium]